MSALSDYLENEIADHILGGGDYTRPATVYAALFTSGPTDAGGGTEVSGSGYARVAITNNLTNWPAASGGTKANGTAISFPSASGSWGTVTHFAIFDATSGGNMLLHGALSASKTVGSGDTPSFGVGDLQFDFD
jgi:hypothetical protein